MFHILADGTEIYNPRNDKMQLLSPRLIMEIGKAGSLEFSVPVTNRYYGKLQQLSTNITVELDDNEIFRGRVLSNNRGFDNTRKIYVEGDLAYLVDSVQKGEKYNGKTHDLFRKIIAAHNSRVDAAKRFTVGTIGIENRDIVIYGQSDEDVEDAETGEIDYRQIVINSTVDDWLNTYDYIESTLIDYCGGYLRTRRVGSTTYLDILTDFGIESSQEIEFGRNILDLTEDISAEDLFTVLIPLGDENLTIESVNGGSDELVDEDAVIRFGRIVRTHTFPSVNQPSTLLENGQRYLASNANIPVSISVKAVDLHFVNSTVVAINVGDRVRINSFPHDIYEYLTCTRIEYDLSNPSNNVYTFGNPKQTLTERYRKDRKKDSGGGGGGAAAAEAEKRADDGLQDFYNAWINLDPEAAHVSLGTLYKDYENTKLVLQRDCGIDIDGETGNINIKSLAKKYDDLGKEISSYSTQINLLNKNSATIEMLAAYVSKEEDQYRQAEFKVWADSVESGIEGKADKISFESLEEKLGDTKDELTATRDVLTRQCGIYLDGTTNNINIRTFYETVNNKLKEQATSIASIQTTANDAQATAIMTAQHISTVNNIVDNNMAEITVRADDLQSQIEMKADKIILYGGEEITLDTAVTRITGRLEAAEASIRAIKANFISANTMSIDTIRCARLIASDTISAAYIGAGQSVTAGVQMTIADNAVATQKWVKDQNYALNSYLFGGYPTELLLNYGFAAKSWVENNFQPISS